MNYDGVGNYQMLMTLYEGDYGMTLRMDCYAIDTVARIKNIFLELAAAQETEIILNEVISTQLVGIQALVLKLASPLQTSDKICHRIQHTEGGMICYWCNDTEEWRECADLLDGIIEYQKPCHQYLTKEVTGEVLIVLAFRETCSDTLRGN